MKDKNKNEKVDYQNLNALIQTARVISKILLVLSLCGIVIFGFIFLEKTQILNIIGTILSISMPLFIGFGFAWIVEPMIRALEKRKLSRKISTFIVYILFVLVLSYSTIVGLQIAKYFKHSLVETKAPVGFCVYKR